MTLGPFGKAYNPHYRFGTDWYARYVGAIDAACRQPAEEDCPTVGIDFYGALEGANEAHKRRAEDIMPVVLSLEGVLVRQRNYMLADPKMSYFNSLAIGAMIAETVPELRMFFQIVELGITIPVPTDDIIRTDRGITEPLLKLRRELRDASGLSSVSHSVIAIPLTGQATMECPNSSSVSVNIWAQRSDASVSMIIDDPEETYESVIAGGVVGLFLGRLLTLQFPKCEISVELSDSMAITVTPKRG